MLIRIYKYFYNTWRLKQDPIRYARSIGVSVGDGCRFINTQLATFGSEPYLITIGSHVTLASGVKFITHDGGVWVFLDVDPDLDHVAPIVVGDNVFIGLETIIMPGVTIGDNCVIGAGSIVTRDIPSGHVAAGVPARPIKTIDAYYEKIASSALHIRNFSNEKKRQYLTEYYKVGS